MSQISSVQIASTYFQSGVGVPSHISSKGSVYIDIDSGVEYINKDGIASWSSLYDSSRGAVFNYGITGTTIQTNSFTANNTGVTQSVGYTILSNLSTLNAVNDAAAAALGVPLYGLYRNGNAVQIRLV